MTTAASILLILAGAMVCLFGFSVYRIWAALTGLVIGIGAGIRMGALYDEASVWVVMAGLALGIALAVVFYYFRMVGAVIAGAGAGFVLMLLFLYAGGSNNWPLALVGAVIGGGCALFFFRPFIVGGSAVGGATALVLGVYALLSGTDLYSFNLSVPIVTGGAAILLTVAIAVLAAIGIAIQSLLLRHRRMVDEDRIRYHLDDR